MKSGEFLALLQKVKYLLQHGTSRLSRFRFSQSVPTPFLCGLRGFRKCGGLLTASHSETQFSFSIQLLTKNPARRYKVAHAWRRRCLARPYAGTKIDNVPSDTGAYLAYLLLPVCSVMASAAGIFTACVPATFVVAAKSRADQGLAKACAETKIDNVPGDTGARP